MTQKEIVRAGRETPTEFQVRDLALPVSDARFDRAMEMAARHMGGTYNRATGIIHLPRELARPGDRSFPTELQVLYRKFPCGLLTLGPNAGRTEDERGAGRPCVSFDVIPKVPGDPRRSRVYQSFKGDMAQSKVLFGKFLGWLKVLSKAIVRYQQQAEQGRPLPFARVASEMLPESMVERVSRQWLLGKNRG